MEPALGLSMTDLQPETRSLSELLKPVAVLILSAISGIAVWSFHNHTWPGFLAYLVVGFVLGSISGGLFDVPLISTWAVMGTTGGLFEGVYQGWQYYGWIGAVPGGLIGIICGIVIAILLSMFMCFVMVMNGIDPFVNAGAEETKKTDVT